MALSDLQTAKAKDLAFVLRIEGIGYTHPGETWSRTVKVFSRDVGWIESAVEHHVMGLKVPESWSQSAVEAMFGGVCRVDGMNFEVEDRDGFWSQLLAFERWQAQTVAFPSTQIAASVDRDDVSIQVLATTGFPAQGTIYIGNETIDYTGLAGGPPRFTGCSRGRHPAWGTTWAYDHRIQMDFDGNFIDNPPRVTTIPSTFFGRQVALYAVDLLRPDRWETEGNAYRFFSGFIRHVDYQSDKGTYRFRCGPFTQVLERKIFSTPKYRGRMVDINLGADPEARTIRFDVPGAPGTPYVYTALQRYWHRAELIQQINTQLSALWDPGVSFALGLGPGEPFVPVDVEAPDGIAYVIGTSNISTGVPPVRSKFSLSIGAGLAAALGWPAQRAPWRWIDLDVKFAIYAPNPMAEQTYFELQGLTDNDPANIPTLYVENASGIITNQGDSGLTPNAYLLIGGRYLFRVTSINTAVFPHEIHGETDLYDGHSDFSAPVLLARGSAVRYPDDEATAVDMTVEQVFAPSPFDTVVETLTHILCSTGTNTKQGAAADYNTTADIYPVGWGVGIRSADIDRIGLLDLEASLRSTSGNSRWVFIEPMTVRAFLDQIGKTFGFSVGMRGGQIVFNRTMSLGLAGAANYTIQESDLWTPDTRFSWSFSPETIANAISIKWRFVPWMGDEGDYLFRTATVVSLDSIEASGELRKIVIENQGLAALQRSAVMEGILHNLFGWLPLFANPIRVLRGKLSRRWWGRLVPLDVVLLTNKMMPDPWLGTIGAADRICIVRKVTENAHGGVDVELYLSPYQHQAPLAPSALLDPVGSGFPGGYDPVGRVLHCHANEFSEWGVPLDASHFKANYTIAIIEDDPTNPAAPTVYRVTVAPGGPVGNTIPIVEDLAAMGYVSPGPADNQHYVTFSLHSLALIAQKRQGSFVGDVADFRIGATADWYPYL